MRFNLPVLVYQEKNCVHNHADEIAQMGKNALIVTGRNSSKKNGSLDDVINALKSKNIKYTVYDGVEENPSVETVMEAREIGVKAGCDFIIGIGGGSPMDAAKAIGVMIYNKNENKDFLYQSVSNSQSLPVIEVPTTCGTGSEVPTVAVLTVHNEKTKKSMSHRIFPRMALVDEKYIKNAPLKVICDTAIDALAHIVESCINNNATEYSKMFAKEGLEAWSKFKDVLLGNREATDEDFHNMMYASTLAGMCIAHAGTSLPHGLSYPITYELGIPHGKAVGYFLPGYINEATDEDKEFVLKAAGFESVEEFSKFYKKACGYEKFPQELLDKTGELILSNQRKLANCPYKVDAEVIKNIISF